MDYYHKKYLKYKKKYLEIKNFEIFSDENDLTGGSAVTPNKIKELEEKVASCESEKKIAEKKIKEISNASKEVLKFFDNKVVPTVPITPTIPIISAGPITPLVPNSPTVFVPNIIPVRR